MILKKWNDLPEFMRTSEIKPYYDSLYNKRWQLFFKRIFDFITAIIMIIILAIPMIIIAIMIKLDSKGPVFYRQERVTTYGKHYKIHKFRTMIINADKVGSAVTIYNDNRITKVGAKLRTHRLDELPQLFDVIKGDMTFVGTRPEVVKYVENYKSEYYATLLIPAGITSEASIRYKDEKKLLNGFNDIDKIYMEQILPNKIKWNLDALKHYSFKNDIITMFRTIMAILGKEYS